MRILIPAQHLANARSKKMICLYDTTDLKYIREKTKSHDIHDHFDGACVFEFKSLEALRLYEKSSDEFNKMQIMYTFHRSCIEQGEFDKEMASLGLVTSIDRRTYGESLVNHFLQK